MAISEEHTHTLPQVFTRLINQLQDIIKKKIDQQTFALVDRVFKHITSQLMSRSAIEGGADELLSKFQEDIVTAISVDNCINKHNMALFLGLDNLDELYLFLIYCKRFYENEALWNRYVAAYSIDGRNQYLNTTWFSLFYKISNENSELALELDDRSKEFFPKPEPEPEPEPELELEFEPEPGPEPEPNKNSGKLIAANSLLPDSFPSKEEKAGWYGIVDAMLGLANVFSALYSVIPSVIKKIEHLTVSTKPEKKSLPKPDAMVVPTSLEAAPAIPLKTTADSQNIFSLFGGIGSAVCRAFDFTVVSGALGVPSYDKDETPRGPTPAA